MSPLLIVILILLAVVFAGLIAASWRILSHDYDLDDQVKATEARLGRMKKAPTERP